MVEFVGEANQWSHRERLTASEKSHSRLQHDEEDFPLLFPARLGEQLRLSIRVEKEISSPSKGASVAESALGLARSKHSFSRLILCVDYCGVDYNRRCQRGLGSLFRQDAPAVP
jgi:hypothetical protein